MRWNQVFVILIAGLCAYLIRLSAPFTADDHFIFYQLQQGGVFGFTGQQPAIFFRPLTSLQYYIDFLFGMSPALSHSINVFWHGICGLLLYRFASRLLLLWGWDGEKVRHTAFYSALLFTVLPANVEAVAWFAARADMIATACALSALLLLMRFQARRQLQYYVVSLLCFAGGLFCKESLVTFPLIAWLWLNYLGVSRASLWAAPFLVVLMVYIIMRSLVLSGLGGYPDTWDILQRPWMLGVNLVAYLFQMGIPAILFGLGRDGWDTLLWILWLIGVGLVFYTKRAHPPDQPPFVNWQLLAGIVLLTLLPVIIFKPSPFYLLNSRYTYLASAFIAVGAGALLTRREQHGWIARAALALLIIAYFGGTLRQADAWRAASEIALSSLLSLKNMPSDQPLVIISLPDHFHGAYIWRAGFHEGVALHHPERQDQTMFVASRFTMRLKTNTSIRYAGGEATLSNGYDIFLPPEGTKESGGSNYTLLPHQLTIHLSQQEQSILLGYHQGKFIRIEP